MENFDKHTLKTVVKLTISLLEIHNHQVGKSAKEILDIKKQTKVKTLNLIEAGLDKKPILKNIVEKFITKELDQVKGKILDEDKIEVYPKDSFYKSLLSSYNEEINETEDLIELKSIILNWKKENENNSYKFFSGNIDGSFMILFQTEKQKETLKR